MGLQKKTDTLLNEIAKLQTVAVKHQNKIAELIAMIYREKARTEKAETELQKLIDKTLTHKIRKFFKNK